MRVTNKVPYRDPYGRSNLLWGTRSMSDSVLTRVKERPWHNANIRKVRQRCVSVTIVCAKRARPHVRVRTFVPVKLFALARVLAGNTEWLLLKRGLREKRFSPDDLEIDRALISLFLCSSQSCNLAQQTRKISREVETLDRLDRGPFSCFPSSASLSASKQLASKSLDSLLKMLSRICWYNVAKYYE